MLVEAPATPSRGRGRPRQPPGSETPGALRKRAWRAKKALLAAGGAPPSAKLKKVPGKMGRPRKADDELSPEDREAKRNTELWKAGNKAKEFGYKWKVRL